ncbi:MAG: hypothetical protein K0R98_557 [Rickettsiaceae bacterium]|jgi:hypothetical protein|nr:hypothetical protein [Rickettsiaceae bacterium]
MVHTSVNDTKITVVLIKNESETRNNKVYKYAARACYRIYTGRIRN